MSKIRTSEELQQWLDEQRLKHQRKKEIEKQRQKKEKAEKKEARKKREAIIKKQQQVLQHSIYVQNRTLQIYRTNGRRAPFSSEDDLYNSWEEIKYAEDKENGRINWERLPSLIEETKKLINGESKSRKRRTSI
ncbi:MAG: hypothetical protein J6S67_01215 [Methanobrevibacter sp.]|nr:hypothetical protein [Methanobrevibacter sp.]